MSPAIAGLISLGFALLATPVVMAHRWFATWEQPSAGQTAPVTVRLPQFVGFAPGDVKSPLAGGSVVVARGQVVDEETAAFVAAVRASAPAGGDAWLVYFAAFLLLGLLYTTHVRRSHTGRLFRTQVVTLSLLLGVALLVKLALLYTSLSVLVVPVAGLALLASLAVDLSVGVATGVVSSILVGLLVPFDFGTVTVLLVQALATVLILAEGRIRNRHIFPVGMFGGLAAATAYLVFYYLAVGKVPMSELADPLRSAWFASAAGGLISGAAAVAFRPFYEHLLGAISKNKLVDLADFSQPLLKQIAEKAPGTWDHSQTMANWAETAANAIGANGLLVRVGAYYHDLGKSLQPNYFIENLQAGEPSPHDRLAPEVSSDAIFSHVTEGIRIARRAGVPERIIDFMHMHHGDGLLEYFWAKCQEQGNPKNLGPEAFRYPGIKPQTRETAILAICDAVEAASRTLKHPDERAIRNLVQRLVYGKLHLGQLDESSLSVADLRKISNSLVASVRHRFHQRIEYPWQRAEREEEELAKQAAQAVAEMEAPAEAEISATQRLIQEPRLDSLDAPRPHWRGRAAQPLETARSLGVAATEPIENDVAGSGEAEHSEARQQDLATASTVPMKGARQPQEGHQSKGRDDLDATGEKQAPVRRTIPLMKFVEDQNKVPAGAAPIAPGNVLSGPPPATREQPPETSPEKEKDSNESGKGDKPTSVLRRHR